MSKWITIPIAFDYIIAESANSRKFEFPSDTNFKGWCFWLSKKLCGDNQTIFLRPEMSVKLRKERRDGDKYEVIDECELSAGKLSQIFMKSKENIKASDAVITITITPDSLSPIENPQPLNELLR